MQNYKQFLISQINKKLDTLLTLVLQAKNNIINIDLGDMLTLIGDLITLKKALLDDIQKDYDNEHKYPSRFHF